MSIRGRTKRELLAKGIFNDIVKSVKEYSSVLPFEDYCYQLKLMNHS